MKLHPAIDRVTSRFRRASIRSKIIALNMITVSFALLLAGAALLINEVVSEKRILAENTVAFAQVMSSVSTAAITFRDNKALTELLNSFGTRPAIVIACVYDSSHKVLSYFARSKDESQCPAAPGPRSQEFLRDYLLVYEPIVLENQQIGTILVVSDLHDLKQELAFDIVLTFFVILAAGLLSFGLSRRIEHFVSGPVRELAETARVISEKRDYSIRAKKSADDETSILIETFNHMLAQVEEQSQKREQMLQEAQNAVKARDEFLSIASHELRTPLTSLKGGVQLIRKLVEKDLIGSYPRSSLLKLLAMNDQEFSRFGRLVDDLLDVTRLSSGRFTLRTERIDLETMIRGVMKQLEEEIRASKSLILLDLRGNMPGLWDRSRIEQVLMNLISNAVKYGAGNPISISTRNDENVAVFTVQDQGIGISKEDQIRLFQRFARATSSRHFGGLGLGLYIARQIVEAHGGTIQIASSPGQGTTLTVRLPLNALKSGDLEVSA